MRILKLLGLPLLLAAGALSTASAQDYPTRPIRVLVAFPAGGSADIVARLVTQKVTENSKFNFVVENRTGAGGNLAFDATAAAAPDGYTLIFSTPGIAINPSLYSRVNFKKEDFTPITLVGESPLVLLTNPSSNLKTVPDLVAATKKSPEAVRFASSGNGSSSHLAMDVLRTMTGMQYLHVPYRGGAQAMSDLVAGQVEVTMLPIAESMSFVRNNRLHAVGQTGSKRSAIAPNVPTIAEGGLKDYSVTTWYMLLGPAKMPKSVVNSLHREFDKALRMPELQEKLKQSGVDVINQGPEQATAYLDKMTKTWADIIKASGTKIE